MFLLRKHRKGKKNKRKRSEKREEPTKLKFAVLDMATTSALQAGATFHTFGDESIADRIHAIQQTESPDLDYSNDAIHVPVEEFLKSFRANGSECICVAYAMKHSLHKSLSGPLFTSLPEDVFVLVEIQTTLVDEYLISSQILETEAGDAVLLDCILSILRNLWYKHTHFRNSFFKDLEHCIASSNDFLLMIEKVDDWLDKVSKRYPHLGWDKEDKKKDSGTALVRQEANDLNSLFASDSVYAAQRAVAFVMQEIEESAIPEQLFSRDWEDKLVQNELALSIVRTYEEYLSDIHNYLRDDFVFHKLIASLVRSTVCFYMKCLLRKADRLRVAKRHAGLPKFGGTRDKPESVQFQSPVRAIRRMSFDIEVLRDYFSSVAKESDALGKMVAHELSALLVVVECMWLAIGQSGSDSAQSLEEFVLVVHKRTGANAAVTKEFLSDLWLLIAPNEKHVLHNTLNVMQKELALISKRIGEQNASCPWKTNRKDEVGMSLEDMLKSMYDDRHAHDAASICGNILRDVKEFHDRTRRPTDKRNFAKAIETSKRLQESFKHGLKPFKEFLAKDMVETKTGYSGSPL